MKNIGIIGISSIASANVYSSYSGGIVGRGNSIVISNCYNMGNVSSFSSSYSGGIVGGV